MRTEIRSAVDLTETMPQTACTACTAPRLAGLNDHKVLEVFKSLQMGGCALACKKGGAFTTVRSPAHVMKNINKIIEATGTKKLDVQKIEDDAKFQFIDCKLWPVMHVLKEDNYYKLSGKGIDHLGGYLQSDVFNGECTGDDKWTVPVPQDGREPMKSLTRPQRALLRVGLDVHSLS